jgi:hypothetical protein
MNKFKQLLLNIKLITKLSFVRNSKDLSIEGIVFSMDRPMQLFALLESYYMYCEYPVPLLIIYKASDLSYERGYDEVKKYFLDREISFIKESSFKKDLLTAINGISASHLFFLVDDNIFKSHFSFNDFTRLPNCENYILSLRLGKNLNYCYTRSLPQSLPAFRLVDKFLSWDIKKGVSDWNYAFSLDGHVYNRELVFKMSSLIPFKAPNSYEGNMNIFRFLLRKRKGLCYPDSLLLNLCLNRVQNESENISGNISTVDLLNYWNNNMKIDINFFYNFKNASAHIEVENVPLKTRN